MAMQLTPRPKQEQAKDLINHFYSFNINYPKKSECYLRAKHYDMFYDILFGLDIDIMHVLMLCDQIKNFQLSIGNPRERVPNVHKIV